MPQRSANVKHEKQYEALKDKRMSKERAAKIASSPGASSRGGEKSGSGGDPSHPARSRGLGDVGHRHAARHAGAALRNVAQLGSVAGYRGTLSTTTDRTSSTG